MATTKKKILIIEDEKRACELGAVGFFIKSNTPIADIVERVKEKLNISS